MFPILPPLDPDYCPPELYVLPEETTRLRTCLGSIMLSAHGMTQSMQNERSWTVVLE
ncbi:uncharacterized protein DS421_10g297180 [Arachis hypogaea]|nr:uncharacterized protein DS421_10g297180 [Arachis hypogaea]